MTTRFPLYTTKTWPHTNGYRYVRSYRVATGEQRWALWERQAGKMRRVGTAHTEQDYRRFLGLDHSQEEAVRHGHDIQA